MYSAGLYLVLAWFLLQGGDATKEDVGCMRPLLEVSLVNYAAIYFADNPRGEHLPISPASIDPLTTDNLFKEYYGEDASASGFKSAISRILYSGLGRSKLKSSPATQDAILAADKVLLRSNIYTYIKAGSYDLSREKFGILLYNSLDELSDQSSKDSCFHTGLQKQMKDFIHAELARVRNEVGENHFGQFLSLGSGTTLAFVIDDTGSMGGEIEAAKRRAINIIDERQGSLDQPQNFVLVPFNDPHVGPMTVTHDAQTFKNAINRLSASGGGDAPELSMNGIQLAVENCNPGSTIFVITDVDAKDIELQDNVVAQAKQKNLKVTFLLTGQIFTSDCYRRACDNPALKRGYELYEYIAQSTGGRILVVGKDDIFQATEVIESTLKQGLENLHIKRYAAGKVEDHFFVDSSLKEIFVQTEGECGNITTKGPDATILPLEVDLEVDELKVLKTPVNGSFGRYFLEFEPTGNCDIMIFGRSTKGFVKTLAKRIPDPKTGEVLLQRFEGQSVVTDNVVILLDEFGKLPGERTEIVYLEEKASNVSYEFPISDQRSIHHMITMDTSPKQPLLVKIVGVDSNGHKFQRVSPTTIEFVSADIDCSVISDMVFRAGDNTSVNVTFTNIGPKETFSVEVNDDKEYVVANGAKELNLAEGSPGHIPIQFSAKKGEVTGTVSTITITASPQGSDILIFKQCRLIIGQKEKPEIESFHAVSNINSRFVETSIESVVFNNASVSRMTEFHVIMPLDSFITEFSMTIDNVTYPGEIEEKEKAKKIFKAAKARGVTAGHVAAREKSTTVFKTSVNLEANKRVIFNLKYQQLLRRIRGKYRHEIIIQTRQPVGKMTVDVHICETRPLTMVNVLGFDTEQSVIPGPMRMPGVTVNQQRTTAHISFKPTREEQLKLSPLGLNGKFVVEYDVERKSGKEINEVVAQNRHFVHFFTSELEPISKRVVLVLDDSASMHGRKMEQVRKAMGGILDGLNEEDVFAIVMFNSNVTTWELGFGGNMAQATVENIQSAKKFLEGAKTKGGTNIALAITTALEVFRNFSEESEKNLHPASDFILMLTDGRPTEGTIVASELVSLIDESNNLTYGIHTIGFGSLVDMGTLSKIAARNNGSSIQIFEDIDADLQISDFFETFGRPMLRDIEVAYTPQQVEATTTPTFPVLIQGQEIVIGGRFSDQFVSTEPRRRRRQTITVQLLEVAVSGKLEDEKDFQLDADVELTSPASDCLEDSIQIKNFTERLNVFMELQHTLKKIAAENNNTLKGQLKQEALNQSLEFGFVTPGITSMVVLKPDDKKDIEEELKKESASAAKESDSGPDVEPTRLPLLGEDDVSDFESLGGSFAVDFESSRGVMEFFGDPHFIVQISPDIKVCFQWDGLEGEMFNVLHDAKNGLTVNGRLKVLTRKEKHIRRVYVDKIGVRMSHENVTIEITCDEIYVTDGTGNTTILTYNPTRSEAIAGIRMIFYKKPKKSVAQVLFEIKPGISFRVIRRFALTEDIANHLDFSVLERKGLSPNVFGVLGQFSREDAWEKPWLYRITTRGKDEPLFWYRRKAIITGLRTLGDYNRKQKIHCWFLSKPEKIFGKRRFQYAVENIFDEPRFKNAPTPRKT